MAEDEPTLELEEDGPAAPPRANGELVFESPWESRLFGMTLALQRSGVIEWDEFRQLLIEEIGRWEDEHSSQSNETDAVYHYYERWHAALEKLLSRRQLCNPGELDERALAFAARPADHDHDHSH